MQKEYFLSKRKQAFLWIEMRCNKFGEDEGGLCSEGRGATTSVVGQHIHLIPKQAVSYLHMER